MPSVNSIVSQASMVARLSTKFFGADFDAANRSVLVGPAFGALNNIVKSDYGGQPALTNMVENYREHQKSFNDELRDNLSSLRESSDKLKESVDGKSKTEDTNTADDDNDNNTGSTLSNLAGFANGNIPPQEKTSMNANSPESRNAINQIGQNEEDDDETNQEPNKTNQRNDRDTLNEFANNYLVAEENSDLSNLETISRDTNNVETRNDLINNVRNLVRDYNSAVSYLNDNRGLSNRMSALANNFSNNSELSGALNSIGIFQNANGELSINETILSLELERNSDNVNSILGSDGLAGNLDRGLDMAERQDEEDNLFPSIYDYTNRQNQDDAESLYTSRNFSTAAYAWENVSRLFTMWT